MRRKVSKSGGEELPLWLITFSDLMTLMLTFFVLLVSMASIVDEEKKKVALGSVTGTFGLGDQGMGVLSTNPRARSRAIEPGALEEVRDLSPLKGMVEDSGNDVDFLSNAFVQILTINSEVMFSPGRSELTERGRALLDLMLPQLRQVSFPVLLSGHTSSMIDEVGLNALQDQAGGLDPSWSLSLARSQAIYRQLVAGGMDPAMLRIEAHGQFQPRFTNDTPEGRIKNRRVDMILDKRNFAREPFLRSMYQQPSDARGPLMYRDFIFDLGGRTDGSR